MAEKQIFNGETVRVGTPLVGVATPTPLMNCCFAGNTNFLVMYIFGPCAVLRHMTIHTAGLVFRLRLTHIVHTKINIIRIAR